MAYSYDRSRYFDIPRRFYFEAGNPTIGSCNTFNYRLAPSADGLNAIVWYGTLSFELSEHEDEENFSIDDEGYRAAIYWIDEHYELYLAKLKNGEVKPRRTYVNE